MSKVQKIAMYLKSIKNLRLNYVYEYCWENGLNSDEIKFVQWYINYNTRG